MGTEVIRMESFRTRNEKCYVGMTSAEASEKGGSVFNEFKETDTDKDGVISVEDMIERRNKSIKVKNIFANILLINGIICCLSVMVTRSLSGNILEMFESMMNKSAKAVEKSNIFELILTGGLGLWMKKNVDKFHKETQDKEKEYLEMIDLKQKEETAKKEATVEETVMSEEISEPQESDTAFAAEQAEEPKKEKLL